MVQLPLFPLLALSGEPTSTIGPALAGAITGAFLAVGLIALTFWRPHLVARVVLWLPFRLLYRLRVRGLKNLPASGPVLLVSNHVSYIDALLILLAQRRPIRFVVWAPFTRVPGLRLY